MFITLIKGHVPTCDQRVSTCIWRMPTDALRLIIPETGNGTYLADVRGEDVRAAGTIGRVPAGGVDLHRDEVLGMPVPLDEAVTPVEAVQPQMLTHVVPSQTRTQQLQRLLPISPLLSPCKQRCRETSQVATLAIG